MIPEPIRYFINRRIKRSKYERYKNIQRGIPYLFSYMDHQINRANIKEQGVIYLSEDKYRLYCDYMHALNKMTIDFLMYKNRFVKRH